MGNYDVTIIGGGIVGLATAWQLLEKHPHLKLGLLEKESEVSRHQTGHNSGVIHSGIYYRPGSLKARYCVAGVRELKKFCDVRGIPYKIVGKLILATNQSEIPRLEELERRGNLNGAEGLKLLDSSQLKEIEPEAQGIKALYSPNTGIIDFAQVAKEYAKKIEELGGTIHLSQEVKKVAVNGNEIVLATPTQEYRTKYLVNCAGIQADRVAHLADPSIRPNQIIPFRGEYYYLSEAKSPLIKGLIYPVPDPKFPFLGVHLTRTIHGTVEAGPNAVLALSRDGYHKSDIRLRDSYDIFRYSGFWKIASRYWKMGAYEFYRSFSKRAFLNDLQKLAPALKRKDLSRGGSGVRSQLVLPDGSIVDDFHIESNSRMIHVLNAPSPAATASISIGKDLSELATKTFGL